MTDDITRLIDPLLNAFIASIYLNDIRIVYPSSQKINVEDKRRHYSRRCSLGQHICRFTGN